MSETQQLYSTVRQGLAAFLTYVLSEDSFSHVTFNENQRPVVWFHDVTAGNSCADFAQMYQDGAQLRDAREYSICWEFIGHKIREAIRASKK